MKNLFLASYFTDVSSLFVEFSHNTCAGKRVVFIFTAKNLEKVPFFVVSDKNTLENLGLIVDELEVSRASQVEVENKIANADYIFVAGGNTFFLLQELKRTGAVKVIAEHINKGKMYLSTSAGSIIVSKDIEYIKHFDSIKAAPKLKNDFSALGIIDFHIVPHCTSFKKATEKILAEYSEKIDLRPIHDKQAIIVKDNQVEIVELIGKAKSKK